MICSYIYLYFHYASLCWRLLWLSLHIINSNTITSLIMIITFRIQYRTIWGENLCVCIDEENIVKLFTVDGYHWQGQTDYHPNPSVSFITYRYEVHREGLASGKNSESFPTNSICRQAMILII